MLNRIATPRVVFSTAETPALFNALAQMIAVAICAAIAAYSLQSSTAARSILALVAFCILILLFRTPRLGVSLSFAYLAILGGVRRWLIPDFGWSANDPLMLVMPAIVGLFFGNLLLSRHLHGDTRLARLLRWLLLIMVIQIFNPLQGGLTVGIAGVLFSIIPLGWYYVGRIMAKPAVVNSVFRTVTAVALAAAVYGIYQNSYGLSAGEQEWVRITKYEQLMGATQRLFSFFTSPAEYSQCLAAGIIILWAAWLCGNRTALIPVPLLMIALFLIGIRGAIVGVLTVSAVLWAVQSRSRNQWIPRGLLALVIAGFGMAWSLNQAQGIEFGSRTHAIVEHQSSGLLDPVGKDSSAHSHFNLVAIGLKSGLTNPLGLGLGATTSASAKFGGVGGSTELDLTNMFVSLGIIGGVLYAVIIFIVLAMAFRLWVMTRAPASLTTLAILLISLGSWLNGGYYSTSMLAWFCIGALDHAQREVSREIAFREIERLPLAGESNVSQ
jgi:hypothetical protein